MRILKAVLFILPVALLLNAPMAAAGVDGAILVVSSSDGPMPNVSGGTKRIKKTRLKAK